MSDLLKYLVVDDAEIDRLTIENEASKFPILYKIAACSHPVEAFELITRFQPDIVFADIEMPDMSGIDLIKKLSGQVAAPVFVTSHPEFAVDGYEIAAFDYLVKPVTAERFAKCVFRLHDFFQLRGKAVAFEKENESNFITIREGYDKYKIPVADILYLEAMKDYTKIVTQSGHFLVLSTLTNMYDKLPPEKFTRIHRSYIANRDKISSVKGNKIFISSNELPIGKLYKNEVDSII
jgi:two-component system, LytTR family, response regulator